MSILALLGGKPVVPKDHHWPSWPILHKADEQAVLKTLRDDKWGVDAKANGEFACAFAGYTNMKHVLPVSTGTAALTLAAKSLGLGAGDEVIVPGYTFVATATAMLDLGITVVFADVDLQTANICLDDVAKKITSRTRAIVPVHFGGNPVPIKQLKKLTKGKPIAIIEDAAQAHGLIYRGKSPGAFTDCSCYSFQSSKNLSSGEGGALVTNSKSLYNKAWSFHSFGRLPHRRWYEHHVLAWNQRMTAMQAALLSSQLIRLEAQTQKRLKNATSLSDKLTKLPGVHPQVCGDEHPTTRRAYHIYLVRFDTALLGVSRDRILQAINAEGLPANGGYFCSLPDMPMFQERRFWHQHEQQAYKRPANEPSYKDVKLPNTEQLCNEAIWMRQEWLLGSKADIARMYNCIEKVISNIDELRNSKKGRSR